LPFWWFMVTHSGYKRH